MLVCFLGLDKTQLDPCGSLNFNPMLMFSMRTTPLCCSIQAQLQDATLASAAVMGMAGEMLSTPFGALTAGFLASQLSLLSSRFLSVSPLVALRSYTFGARGGCIPISTRTVGASTPPTPNPAPLRSPPSPSYDPG